MPYLKILLFLNFFLLIFQYSSCIIHRDQRLLVESKQKFFRLFGSNINYPLIKLTKLELKKFKLDLNLDEDQQQYVTEIVIEINEIKNFTFYISPFIDPCNEQGWSKVYNTNNAIIGENGKKQMTIEKNYLLLEYYTDGILICGLNDRIGETLLTIFPLFYAKIDFEVNNELYNLLSFQKKEVNINGIDTHFGHGGGLHKLIKINCFLNPEGPRKLIKNKKFIEKGEKLLGENNFIDNSVINEKHRQSELEGISYINICLKFEHSGKYKIRVMSSNIWKEPKMELHFYIKINEENKIKCFSEKFIDYKNQNEIDFLTQLREGIRIYVIDYYEDLNDYIKLEMVEEFDHDDYDIDNYTNLKPFFKEDFKFNEEE
ncbi:unnamed protein product [Meloidogyne enterolobii]|uniref:Uncharacterized protein n=1 Tax=Meloidogyne enterolobii TaxID=390850 RepID=A0ACB1B8E8_MELEN